MNALHFYFLSLLCFGGGIAAAVVFRSREKFINYLAHGMAALGSAFAVLCAIFIYQEGSSAIPLLHGAWIGLATARLDGLAAFFLLLTGLVGSLASLYAVGYCKEYYGRRLWVMAAAYNGFLLTMILVFTVHHIAAFLLFWELMALTSFLLVNQEWEKAAVRRAAYVYLVMTHIGTAFILMAFFLLADGAASLDFADLQQAHLTPTARNLVFIFALIGFGTKAGIVPLHVWLPMAHPAAPSHVSALMSGIMLKTAIYGLLRFWISFLGIGPAWWGYAVLAAGVLSCVLGILYALMERDLKRLLAYSSVDNVGIILLGLGAGLVFMAKGQAGLAGIAWGAALFHTLNHALFKSLLFFGAGAVLQSAHTKNMEKLGGLIRKMPYTAFGFLIGSAAIAALPPFNGFVSEWLTFQALFALPHAVGGIGGRVTAAMLLALFGLTGALAAACFVKAFGVAFLAKPRSRQAEQAQDVSWTMTAPMGLLAGACLVIGIWPQPVMRLLAATMAGWPAVALTGFEAYGVSGLALQAGAGGSVADVPAFLTLFLLGALAALVVILAGRSRERTGETWTCGIIPTARMAYTATGFSKPVRIAFRSILRPERRKVIESGGNRYFGRRVAYQVSIRDLLSDKLYRPLNDAIVRAAKTVRALQSGSLQLYIGYVLAVTAAALIWSSR